MEFIRRHVRGIEVKELEHVTIYQQGVKKWINDCCLENGSTLKGRMQAARYLLGVTQIPPIYVSSHCILFCSKALRKMDMVCINSEMVIGLYPLDRGSTILLNDGFELVVDTSYKTMKKRYKQAKELQKLLENH